jgi:hypothetical protein
VENISVPPDVGKEHVEQVVTSKNIKEQFQDAFVKKLNNLK